MSGANQKDIHDEARGSVDIVPHPILLYDGACGLCNRLVQFILKRDSTGTFRFASLQSRMAARVLARHGVNSGDLDTVYIVLNHDHAKADSARHDRTIGQEREESLLSRSDAVLFVLRELGGIWRPVARVLQFVPRFVRNWVYCAVAHYRYRVFGRYEACPVPSETTRARFLDM